MDQARSMNPPITVVTTYNKPFPALGTIDATMSAVGYMLREWGVKEFCLRHDAVQSKPARDSWCVTISVFVHNPDHVEPARLYLQTNLSTLASTPCRVE